MPPEQIGYKHTEQTDEEWYEGPSYHIETQTVDQREAEYAAEDIGYRRMEGHQNLLAIAGVQNAQTEWQHTAHEIIAVAVHRLALGIVKAQQQLDADAEKH